jgi:hypothetical protein
MWINAPPASAGACWSASAVSVENEPNGENRWTF